MMMHQVMCWHFFFKNPLYTWQAHQYCVKILAPFCNSVLQIVSWLLTKYSSKWPSEDTDSPWQLEMTMFWLSNTISLSSNLISPSFNLYSDIIRQCSKNMSLDLFSTRPIGFSWKNAAGWREKVAEASSTFGSGGIFQSSYLPVI